MAVEDEAPDVTGGVVGAGTPLPHGCRERRRRTLAAAPDHLAYLMQPPRSLLRPAPRQPQSACTARRSATWSATPIPVSASITSYAPPAEKPGGVSIAPGYVEMPSMSFVVRPASAIAAG